jgi:hypothetical protein
MTDYLKSSNHYRTRIACPESLIYIQYTPCVRMMCMSIQCTYLHMQALLYVYYTSIMYVCTYGRSKFGAIWSAFPVLLGIMKFYLLTKTQEKTLALAQTD